MASLWHDLLSEWRLRLQACRDALREHGDRSAAAAILRIRERILCFLLQRYDAPPTVAAPQETRPEEPEIERVSFAAYIASVKPPEVHPSSAFPPRRGRELCAQIVDISVQVQSSRRKRWTWWFW